MKIRTFQWDKSLPSGYDVTDFFAKGQTAEEFEKLMSEAKEFTESDRQSSQISDNSPGVQYQSFVPNIDKEVLTPALKRFLKAVSTTTDAPDEFLLLSHITHWAGVVGNKIFFPDATGKFRLNIWCVCFADSSVARKSTALKTAGKPYQAVQRQLDKEYREEYWEYSDQHEQWENLDEEVKIESPEPQEPAKKRLLLASDFSDAGCYIIMKNNPISGVIVASEFADYFKKLHRDWTGQANALLAAYDNDRMIRVTRKHGEEVIEEPTFSVLGATTFASFTSVFGSTETENGFLSRLFPMVVSTPTKKRKGFLQRERIDHEFFYQMERQIKNWVDFDGDIELFISKEIDKAFTEWEFAFVEKSHKKYSDTLNPSIERMASGCFKLAMILQSLEVDDPSGLTKIKLRPDVLKCAQMLIENVMLPSMNYLFDNKIVKTKNERNEEIVIRVFKKFGESLDRSKLRKKSRLSSEDLDKAIQSLVRQYKIRISVTSIDREQGGGSPKTFYTLNDY